MFCAGTWWGLCCWRSRWTRMATCRTPSGTSSPNIPIACCMYCTVYSASNRWVSWVDALVINVPKQALYCLKGEWFSCICALVINVLKHALYCLKGVGVFLHWCITVYFTTVLKISYILFFIYSILVIIIEQYSFFRLFLIEVVSMMNCDWPNNTDGIVFIFNINSTVSVKISQLKNAIW